MGGNYTQDSGGVRRGAEGQGQGEGEVQGQGQGQGKGEGDKRLLKISVKEVLSQHGGVGGLSEAQLVTLLVLGGVTLAMLGLTGALVLRGHWQKHCAPRCRCRPPPSSSSPSSSSSSSPSPSPLRFFRGCRGRAQEVRPSPPPGEQECKISFLEPPPDPPGPEKKKLNSEVI